MNLDTMGLLQFTASTLMSYMPSMNRRDKNNNTILSGKSEIAHNIAAASQRKYNSDYDYDTRGFFQQYGSFLPTGIESSNGHLTDEYKKWNHPTQSVESKLYLGGYKAVNWNKEPYRTLGSDAKTSVSPSVKNKSYRGYNLFNAIL